MRYSEFIEKLRSLAEPSFAEFQRRLIKTKYTILGVRTPALRKLAKEFAPFLETLWDFPNEYYETVFIKLSVVSGLSYDDFIAKLPQCVALMDNWALCDCFKAKCIRKRKQAFLSELDKLFARGGEYFQRYPLVVLLSEYTEAAYLSEIRSYLLQANTDYYYVHMAAAWLLAEVLIKQYDYGVALLQEKALPPKTHNKAIQKAVESYRLTEEQKNYLKTLKV